MSFSISSFLYYPFQLLSFMLAESIKQCAKTTDKTLKESTKSGSGVAGTVQEALITWPEAGR